MKILLMGDASNYHATLAIGLRNLGHEVTVASNGSYWMETPRDIDLSRHESKIGGAILWARLNTLLAPKLKGYDVVQLSSPVFVDLRPHRVAQVFDKLRRDNGGVFLTALGTDSNYVTECLDPRSPIEYSEWSLWGRTTPYRLANPDFVSRWQAKPLSDLCRKIYSEVDGVVSALYEYDVACRRLVEPDRLCYGGLPINLERPVPLGRPLGEGKIRLFLGRHKSRLFEKGTDVLEKVGREVQSADPANFTFDIVENLPYREYLSRLRGADIVFDQLYSYTPATNALLAMSTGQVAVSGGEEAFYRFIGEERLRPVINAVPGREQALVERLLSFASHRGELNALGRQGREFVKKHHDVNLVAGRFVRFWERRLNAR